MTALEKPPYRVPSMAEVAALRGTNGLSAASTFSGCGGSCLGFEMAGYSVLWASEFVPAAREVYELNHPGVPVDARDVREVTADDVLAAIGLGAGELDLLEGSPPCASFSTAGKRSEHWGQAKKYSDTTQRTDDLFFEFARLVRGIQPRTFVAENVSGLVKGVAKGYFKEILRALKACGYVVEARLLDAQWLGVPQHRQRLIFQGVRADLGLAPTWPKPLPYRYSIRDALPWIGGYRFDTGGDHQARDPERDPERDPAHSIVASSSAAQHHRVTGRTGPGFRRVESELDEPMNTVLAEDPAHTKCEVQFGPQSPFYDPAKRLDNGGPLPTVAAQNPNQFYVAGDGPSLGGTAVGAEWDRLRPGESSDRYFNLVRPDEARPLPTVTAMGGASAGVASVTHPSERRKFTIAELRRLCAFPDDFILTGTYAQQWERLGRAVPPLMMRSVAEAVRDGVLLPWHAS